MTYVGRGVDAISNVEKLDNITFNGGTTYNLTKSSVAFTPSGKNNILVSINGVVQQGNFTVAGATIVFDFSPTSDDTCNFIMHYGTGVLNVPADDTVKTATVQDDAITTDKLANSINSAITANTAKTTNATHSGEVTGATALTIADNIVDEANLKVSNSPTNGYMLTAQSGASGGLTWAEAGGGSFVKLSSGSASASVNHDFTGFINTSTYDNYWIFLGNIKGQQGNTIDFQFTDSSGVLSGSHYYFSGHGWRSSDNAVNLNGEATPQMSLVAPSSGATNHPTHCQFYMTVNPNGNREGITVQGMSWGYREDVSDVMICNIMGWYNQPSTVTGFRVHAQGNDATTFDYQIYGIVK